MSGAAATTETKDYLGMNDDDFLNLNSPAVAAAASDDTQGQQETAGSEVAEEQTTNDGAQVDTQAKPEDVKDPKDAGAADDVVDADAQPDPAAKDKDGGKVEDAPGSKAKPDATVDDQGKAKTQDPKVAPKADAKPDGAKDGTNKDVAEPAKVVDYEGFFKQVMAPFKANGRTIELKSPEEVIRMLQMGAGYGRKMQDLQPALKTLKMLEKADLLDEGKLSFLIDINNKNPEAIKKLIKDAGIDPLDLNIGDNVSYTPTSHSVSDKEMAFTDVVDELKAHPAGMETLRIVNQTWDQESKSALWESPQILGIIQSQRENGIYDQISAEIERQKLLGQISPNTPFLQAYKLAGDHLTATHGFKDASGKPIQTQSTDTSQPQVIATRTAAPKAQVQNGDKAKAAAETKAAPRKAGAILNPLEMRDEDFLKQFEGRL